MGGPWTADDHRHMARALRLATKGLFSTDPNPRVGCVLVRDGQAIGEAWHQRPGEPHAEVLALRDAGEKSKGATAYVTLEPCSHFGKTPPCANALLAAGVTRVVAAMVDPNPLVSGQGLERLRAAGCEVSSGLMETQARDLNPGFIKRMETGLPFVRIKSAMSLDGRTAMADGESKWITSEASRADVQHWRARSSAVLTGIGTVLADDPSMNVRIEDKNAETNSIRQPLRVVLDSRGRLSPEMKIVNQPGEALVFTGADAKGLQEVKTIQVSHSERGLDLLQVLKELAVQGLNEILVEAGPTLTGAFVAAGLVDEIVIYQAPHLMGDGAQGLFHLPDLQHMQQRKALDIVDIRRFGPDLRIIARPSDTAST